MLVTVRVATRSLVDEPAGDAVVRVDAPVAQERPALALALDLGQVDVGEEQRLAIGRTLDEDPPVRRRDEALAPELDAARAGGVGLEAGAVDRDHEAAVGDRVRAL